MTASPILPPDEVTPRMRLLLAAEEVFADKGYDAATVREITTRAGMNIAAINYHFRNKEEMYIEAVRFAHVCAGRMDTMPVPPADTPPVERLKAFIREMVTRMHAPTRASAMKLVMRELADPGKAAHVIVAEFIQPVAFALREILRELLPGLDARRLLATGFSVMGQVLFYRQNRPVSELIFGKEEVATLDLELVIDHVTQFTLAALGQAEPYSVQAIEPIDSIEIAEKGNP
jgi:TetR/AcrR family transcriptional regulator, regulator of cefoperazone and chloramphenicol sensitivity